MAAVGGTRAAQSRTEMHMNDIINIRIEQTLFTTVEYIFVVFFFLIIELVLIVFVISVSETTYS